MGSCPPPPARRLGCCWLAWGCHLLQGMSWAGEGLHGLVLFPATLAAPLLRPRCQAEAGEPRGPLTLTETLGAKWDVCSHLTWESNFRASRLWSDQLESRDSVSSSDCFRGRGHSLSPWDPEGLGRVREDPESLLVSFVKCVCMCLFGKERALSFHPVLNWIPNPTKVELHDGGLRLPAPALRPSFLISP